jgi:hypothetical protein
MYNFSCPPASRAYAFGGLIGFGGWRPPSDETLAAALGLAITASVAIRLALEVPRNGDIMGAFNACRHVQTAATLFISHFRAS